MDPRTVSAGERAELSPEDGREFETLVAGCLQGLAEEIEAVREELKLRGLERPVPASGGRLLEEGAAGYRYEWLLSGREYNIRPDDGVRVRAEAGETLGFVMGYHRPSGKVRIAVSDWLGRRPGPAELEFDPTWLLNALVMRLESIQAKPERFHPETALRLFGRSRPTLSTAKPCLRSSEELNEVQHQSLSRLLGSDVHFVWGPPGTGKTLLLGHAVAELAERGKVLVVATTNGALDEAAGRTVASLGEEAVRSGRLIRVAAEFSPSGDAELSLGAAVERRLAAGASGMLAGLTALERRLLKRYEPQLGAQEILRPGGGGPEGDGRVDYRGYRARLARVSTAARAAGDEEASRSVSRLTGELYRQGVCALREADVVLSTLAGLAVREEMTSLRFSSLVLDEASAASLPYVLLAACLSSERAVAIGDFQQLSAIVASRGEAAVRWLSRDVFREAGILGEVPPGETALPSAQDRLCAMLVEQYRMARPIRALVSDLFYGGRLRDATEVQTRSSPRHSLVWLETSALGPSVERAEGSRANTAHAEAVVEFLAELGALGIHDVAVIVPYRLQARRVWRLVRARLGQTGPRDLEISTVHRFQGREKSVVIFDTVDAPPGRSWFLNEGRNREFPRLLNVALSRTRDMLVVVGTAEGLRRTLPEEALLNRVADRIQREGMVLDARELRSSTRRLFRAS